MPRAAIAALGTCVPDRVSRNADSARSSWTRATPGSGSGPGLRSGAGRSGGCRRPPTSPPRRPARAPSPNAGWEPKDVEAIAHATLSPDDFFPGSGVLPRRQARRLPGVPALDVRNQCSGFLYSLSVARRLVEPGRTRTCSSSGAEVHSTGLEFNERGRDVAVLFGDGAGAVLVGTSPE